MSIAAFMKCDYRFCFLVFFFSFLSLLNHKFLPKTKPTTKTDNHKFLPKTKPTTRQIIINSCPNSLLYILKILLYTKTLKFIAKILKFIAIYTSPNYASSQNNYIQNSKFPTILQVYTSQMLQNAPQKSALFISKLYLKMYSFSVRPHQICET